MCIICVLLSFVVRGTTCHCETHVFYSLDEARKAKPECVDTLIIADVESFPDLCSFVHLKYLHIRNHTLRSIPSSMVNCLKHLEVLKVNYGLLQSVPIDLDLKHLVDLDLSQNRIDTVAGPFDRLKHVQTLSLSNNPLHVVSIDAILELKELRLLSLYRNHGQPNLFDAEQQERIAGTLKSCMLWFEPSRPYSAP